jgi:DNA-binding transcriptional LysR family regulator
MQPNPTLDQLQVFLAIADTGSFSAAGRLLRRAQSVVSYTIANLEAQLELKLFEREGTREPRLTEAGRAMLQDARRMVSALQDLRARAVGLKQGLEPELTIAVDAMMPMPALIETLKVFETEFPTVGLKLNVGALGMIWQQLLSRQSDLGLGGAPFRESAEMVGVRIGEASMVPVAAPGHPLAGYPPPVPLARLRDHIQLVVSDITDVTKGKDFGVFAYRTWRMTDTSTKLDLIRGGLGWGGLPVWMVQEDLASGRLVALDLEPYPQRGYVLYAYHRADAPPGPAARWLIERFKQELPKVCSTAPSSILTGVRPRAPGA